MNLKELPDGLDVKIYFSPNKSTLSLNMLEWGVDSVDGQSGEIEMGERTIC